MCYDAEYLLKKQLLEAERFGASEAALQEIRDKLKKLLTPAEGGSATPQSFDDTLPVFYHVSGFSHPIHIVFGATKPFKGQVAEWGLIPPWVKTVKEAYDPSKPYNNNLNAKANGIFEKKSFVKAAKYGRCIVAIDAYYEHHEYKGQKYPFKIFKKDGGPLYIGCIAQKNRLLDESTGELLEKITIALLTTDANPLLARIHNSPAMLKRGGHRMLVILDEEQVPAFLQPYPYMPSEVADPVVEADFQDKILNLCVPSDETKLGYFSVRNLRPRKQMDYIGNVPEIAQEYHWDELDYSAIDKV